MSGVDGKDDADFLLPSPHLDISLIDPHLIPQASGVIFSSAAS